MTKPVRLLAALMSAVAAITSGVHAAVPLTDVASVTAGAYHSCALSRGGAVRCWGNNAHGELGDGTTTSASAPMPVVKDSLARGYVAVVAAGAQGYSPPYGGGHSCALNEALGGAVKCWGNNAFGQLGNGTTTDALSPVEVAGLSSGAGVVAIAAGGSASGGATPVGSHSCALTREGGVKCWGANVAGQLGDGTTTNASTPVDVVGLSSGVMAIAAGGGHTCALTTGGAVKCWGWNFAGQLGDGTTVNAITPVDVSGLGTGVVAITAGMHHSCVVTTAGGAKCWGRNHRGQLGIGSRVDASFPADVTGLASGVAAIAAGGAIGLYDPSHTCARMQSGAVKCWGDNDYGQLGTDYSEAGAWPGAYALTPVDVIGLGGNATAIATGGTHTCATLTSGEARCWGSNGSGELGNGQRTVAPVPVDVAGLGNGTKAIATGLFHACAVTAAGGIRCWGNNAVGRLGNGTTMASSTPVDVVGLPAGNAAIAVGGGHACVLTSAGGVKCWGSNYYGQLGVAGPPYAYWSSTPVDVPALPAGVNAIVAGWGHNCAVTTSGGVKCWGNNREGQLGDGTMVSWSSTPVDVVGLTAGGAAVAAGESHSCALMTAGPVKCWGDNSRGQLGNGTTASAPTPVDVTGLSAGVVSIAAGYDHSCALTVTGAVKCWGDNAAGQLGNGTTANALIPTDVAGLPTGATSIAAGVGHSCARVPGGAAKCWGRNDFGQLGDGTTVNALMPVDVIGLPAGAAAIAPGYGHTCALTHPFGGAKCWGWNEDGQLGNGAAIYNRVPHAVVVAACADFTDVAPDSPFCPNVEWLRNRAVTLGCSSSNAYCPDDAVGRLAMAAYVNRTGTVLAPAVLARQAASGALDPEAAPVVCATGDVPAAAGPRHVGADAVFTAAAAGSLDLAVTVVASVDGGRAWYPVAEMRTTVRGDHWSGVRLLGDFELESGLTTRFGLRVSRLGAPGGATLSDSACNLRIRIDNRNGLASPY